MFLQKILFISLTVLSRFVRISSHWSTHTNNTGKTIEDGTMLYTRGPRIAILQANGSFELTGIFAIKFVRTKDGKCISCKPFICTIKKGDKVYFGNAARKKCEEIHSPSSS